MLQHVTILASAAAQDAASRGPSGAQVGTVTCRPRATGTRTTRNSSDAVGDGQGRQQHVVPSALGVCSPACAPVPATLALLSRLDGSDGAVGAHTPGAEEQELHARPLGRAQRTAILRRVGRRAWTARRSGAVPSRAAVPNGGR